MYPPIKSVKTILFFLFVLPLVLGQSNLYFMKFIQEGFAYFFCCWACFFDWTALTLCSRVVQRNSFFAVLAYLSLAFIYYIFADNSFNFIFLLMLLLFLCLCINMLIIMKRLLVSGLLYL